MQSHGGWPSCRRLSQCNHGKNMIDTETPSNEAAPPYNRQHSRFWRRVRKRGENDCWLWTGATKGRSQDAQYGCLFSGKRTRAGNPLPVPAHRVSYELHVGPVPDGLHLDHLCRVSRCVNPDHLEPVTLRENLLRGADARRRDHCPHGHPYDEENTYVHRGHRYCRTCNRISHRIKEA